MTPGWVEHFDVIDHGTVVAFRPKTPAALEWWREWVEPEADWQRMGPFIVVDHRPARDILTAIALEWPISVH